MESFSSKQPVAVVEEKLADDKLKLVFLWCARGDVVAIQAGGDYMDTATVSNHFH